MSDPKAGPSGGYLLVVDDNEMNRDMLARRLERKGHTVDRADDGRHALDLIARNRYDLILLDIMMPGVDGVDVLRQIRDRYSVTDLPVIMVTAKDHSQDIVQALGLGASDYVTKPLDFPVVLARVQTQLRLRQLAAVKDQFLRIASHDLKNPLTTILSTTAIVGEMVPVGAPMTAEVKQTLERLQNRALEMQRIIEDFLDFQALEDGHLRTEFKDTDVNRIAREVLENNLDYAGDKQIQVQLEACETVREIRADPIRLAQVAQNLVGNAIKFSPRGTGVVIRTRCDGETVCLEVSDNGPGLSDEDLGKLFTKYARLSNKPTGGEKSSGLGLYICKQFIDAHNGEIGARNNDDRGATFWFRVPQRPPTG